MYDVHSVDIALLLLRCALGLSLLGHGTQKLFGWFGGPGLAGTGEFFASIGFRPGRVNALLAGLGEAGGGLLLVLGLLTPLAGAAAVATMVVAASVHVSAGFFAQNGGFELPGFFAVSAAVLVLGGPGRYSVDGLVGYPFAQVWIGLVALVVAVIAAMGMVVSRRRALLTEA